MGKLSNIFGVLALLLAGAAAFFSFTISQRRAEFRLRADKMATAVVEIVRTVDTDSGTALASEVTFTPGDPKLRKKDSGALSSVEFHQAKDESGAYNAFQAHLDKALAHVRDLAKRRNDLAQVLTATAATLGLPEDHLADADLRGLADSQAFSDATQTVQSHADALVRRDAAILDTLDKTAQAIGESIDKQALTTRKQEQNDEGEPQLGDYPCSFTLDAFRKGVTDLNERAEAFGRTIVAAMANVKRHEGIFEWSVSPADVKAKQKDSYDPAHIEFINDFGKINDQLDNLVAARIELVENKKRIDALETDLSAANAKIRDNEVTIGKRDLRIRELERRLALLDDNFQIDGAPSNKELVGQVRQVDPDYNYVILNLGKTDRISKGTELLVARGDEYVAKVRVTQVLDTISVADVLPVAAKGEVKPDDQVILAVPAKRN